MAISLKKRCEVCGGDGFEELLVTCSGCKVTTEHVYCMRYNDTVIPEVWFCENCNRDKHNEAENSLNPSGSGVMQGGVAKSNDLVHRRTKPKPTGKVKFIDAEEVIKLSSGVPTNVGSPSKSNFNYRSSASVTPKLSPLEDKLNPKGILSMKPPGHGRIQASAISSQQSNRTAKDKRVTFHVEKGSSWKEQNTGFIKTAKRTKTASIKLLVKEMEKRETTSISRKEKTADDAANISRPTSSVNVHHLPTVDEKISGSKAFCGQPPRLSLPAHLSGRSNHRVDDSSKPEVEVEKRHILTTIPINNAYRSYFPSEDEIWKGGFKFFDTVMPGKFYGGFKAQLPIRISRKVYDFSSTIPIILQVALLPRDQVWAYLFQNDVPDLRDIALYFFPSSNVERSKETYASLFERLESKSSVMLSCIGDVELIIFTSKQLHADSLDVAERSFRGQFLWAVFRHSKDKIPQNQDNASVKSSSPVDMEIDMEGGQLIGRVDIVVEEKFTDARHELDVPPGFEEQFKQKATVVSPEKVREIDHQALKTSETSRPTSWTPPPKGWIKLNIGGSLKKAKPLTAGGSGIIRDDTSKWICGYSLHSETILEAELWSIYQGLNLAWEKGFRKVIVESKNLTTVEHLTETRTSEGPNSIPVECCINLMKRDWKCRVVHVDRQANLSAIWLATRFDEHQPGLTVFKSPPDGLVPLLQFDTWGFCPPLGPRLVEHTCR